MKKIVVFVFLLLTQVSASAVERAETSSGTGTGSTETQACDEAMKQARNIAARRAGVQVKPLLEKMLSTAKVEVAEDIDSLAFELTVKATRVYKNKLSPSRDSKTGKITCNAMAVFSIDLSKVEEAFQAIINEKKQAEQHAAEQRLKQIEEPEKKAAKIKVEEEPKKQTPSKAKDPNFNPFPDE